MEDILFIFKDRPWYKHHIIEKFKNKKKINFFFLKDFYCISREQIIKKINNKIKKNKIKKTFFDIDYKSFIDRNFISSISTKSKILISWDFEENKKKIFRSIDCFTHLLIAEPKFVNFLNKKKHNSIFFPLETNKKYFHKIKKEKKIYDILFFGELKADREKYIDMLKGTKFKIKILVNSHKKISDSRINKAINQSRIILNFSKGVSKYNNKTYDQFKGRVILSGLANTFCLSEKYESANHIFKNKYPVFNSEINLKKKIELLLNKKQFLNKITQKFSRECTNYADHRYMKKIFKFLESERNESTKHKIDYEEILNVIKISYKRSGAKILCLNFIDLVLQSEIQRIFKILFLIFITPLLFTLSSIKNLKNDFRKI